jgi:hypothetical protein
MYCTSHNRTCCSSKLLKKENAECLYSAGVKFWDIAVTFFEFDVDFSP